MSEFIDKLGVSVVARMCRVSVPSVIAWRKRSIPAERCPHIELGSGGEFLADALRPDVRWVRVPDDRWPHPAGRPCIDPCGPAPAVGVAQAQQQAA